MSENTRSHKKPVSTASASIVIPSHSSPAVRAGTSSGGQALDKHTQASMSARFGHDFSSVRIHTDARAEESAQAMGANAYAHGSDIVFGTGKYQPGSQETERLLAHELTHVAQQARFGPGDWGRTSGKGDASEREADSLASQVMMGQNVSIQAAPGAAVAREEGGNGGWMDHLFGLDPTKSFMETLWNGLEGPGSPAQIKDGDSDWTKLGRAGYAAGAGMVGGILTPGAEALDNLQYGPFNLGEEGIKQKSPSAPE